MSRIRIYFIVLYFVTMAMISLAFKPPNKAYETLVQQLEATNALQ